MIDLHSHVLPGLDDGPPDLAGSLALARAAVEAGTRLMAATPHIGHQYAVEPDELPARVASLQEELDEERIPLEVVTGGELAPGRAADLSVDELEAIALDRGACVLLECPFGMSGGLMPALVAHVHDSGFRVLLAHPERSPELLRDPALLASLVDAGAFVQITAGSLRGDFGRTARRYAAGLLAEGLVHVVASDAHDAHTRDPALVSIVADAVRQAGLAPAVTPYLTEHAPLALLDDEPVPRFPVQETRRRVWARRR